jgi:hypothetical protein
MQFAELVKRRPVHMDQFQHEMVGGFHRSSHPRLQKRELEQCDQVPETRSRRRPTASDSAALQPGWHRPKRETVRHAASWHEHEAFVSTRASDAARFFGTQVSDAARVRFFSTQVSDAARVSDPQAEAIQNARVQTARQPRRARWDRTVAAAYAKLSPISDWEDPATRRGCDAPSEQRVRSVRRGECGLAGLEPLQVRTAHWAVLRRRGVRCGFRRDVAALCVGLRVPCGPWGPPYDLVRSH